MSSLVFLPAALCWWAKKNNNNNSKCFAHLNHTYFVKMTPLG